MPKYYASTKLGYLRLTFTDDLLHKSANAGASKSAQVDWTRRKGSPTTSVANRQRPASDDAFRWLTVVNQAARWTLAINIHTLTAELTALLS